MKIIESLQNETIKNIDKLNDKKTRKLKQEFLVEGYHLVDEAKQHQVLQTVLATKEEDFKRYPKAKHYLVTKAIIKKLSKTVNPQEILGIVQMPELKKVDLDKEDIKIALFENINDPGNLGSMVRTAAALGYDVVYVSHDSVDIYNEKALRATQGAIFKIPVYYVHLEEMVKTLKNHHIKCYGTSLHQAKDLQEIQKVSKFAICFGNEARGMSQTLMNMMDENIKIEMKRDVESLNVLAASSIILYQLK